MMNESVHSMNWHQALCIRQIGAMDKQSVIDSTRRWISSIVIGLNLCPFAQRVFQAERIRYVVTDASEERTLLKDLAAELDLLASSAISRIETTLLIHPQAFGDFLDYNDFLDVAEQLVADLGLMGTIQIASFHPDYQFADTEPDAVENYTNRSPYPMLHLLREESVSDAADDPNELLEIPRRNIEVLRALGSEKFLEKLKTIKDGLSDEQDGRGDAAWK
jgi:hypothetical protein